MKTVSVSRRPDALKKIKKETGKAFASFDMIAPDDRILAAVSGGKDSLMLAYMLEYFKQRAPIHFEYKPVYVDLGVPRESITDVRDFFRAFGGDLEIIRSSVYDVVRSKKKEKSYKNKSPCVLCSRLRRGILYDFARKRGFNKIALGHHRGDVRETFLMNAFFAGSIKTLRPVYKTKEYDFKVIRPLWGVEPGWIDAFIKANRWPLVKKGRCGEPAFSGRKAAAWVIKKMEKKFPGLSVNFFRAIENSLFK